MFEDTDKEDIEFRIWPDYTIQEVEDRIYSWMSDDFTIITASNEEEAIKKYKELGY